MATFVGQPIVIGSSTDVHSTAVNKLGTRAKDGNNNEYIFLSGVASTAVGSWVAYDEAYATVGVDTDVAASVKSPVAVAQAAVGANQYGWYMIFGSCSAAAATVADNGNVFATSTVFVCDDAPVANVQVVGATWRSTDASNLATVQLSYPYIGVDEAA
jgi:hypothetical protein